MRITLFCHSLVSDWNHGNAHFLRGVVRELGRLGHKVDVLEPEGAWSVTNLVRDAGEEAIADARSALGPQLRSRTYEPSAIDLDAELEGRDLVLVHDWIEPALAGAIGERRRRRDDHVLLFYDAHHRAVTAPDQIAAFRLDGYDGVLAFGAVIAQVYRDRGWARRAWVWHEAADVELFHPHPEIERTEELVWVGNWGDGERTAELHEFLLGPAAELRLRGTVYGVRYPPAAREAVAAAGLRYGGWLANYRAPEVFARHRMTVHVPRAAYARRIPGVPTIRVFEALACGIPLLSAPWDDTEGLFRPGQDFLAVDDRAAMRQTMEQLLADPEWAAQLAASGLERIRQRHTCTHRVSELMSIVEEVGAG